MVPGCAELTSVNVCGTSLERGVSVRNGHTGIVVQVNFDVTTDDTSERPHEFINLTRIGTSHSISDSHSVDTNLVDSLVNREQVDQVRTERIFRRESNLDPLRLDKVYNFDGRLGDVGHILAVREFTEEGGCSDDDVNTVDTYPTQENASIKFALFYLDQCQKGAHTSFDGDSSIIHMAPDVREDFGLQPKLADCFTVLTRLFRRSG